MNKKNEETNFNILISFVNHSIGIFKKSNLDHNLVLIVMIVGKCCDFNGRINNQSPKYKYKESYC